MKGTTAIIALTLSFSATSLLAQDSGYYAGVEFDLGGGWFTAAEVVHRDLEGSYISGFLDYYFDYTTAQKKIGKRF